jgi:hypothetical protein
MVNQAKLQELRRGILLGDGRRTIQSNRYASQYGARRKTSARMPTQHAAFGQSQFSFGNKGQIGFGKRRAQTVEISKL